MKILSFDALRTTKFKGVSYMKPELLFKEKESVLEADWILYPPYWQINTLVYGLKKNIFPNIATYHLGHNKIEMTRALSSVLPNHIPYTEIQPNTDAGRNFIMDYFDFPFIAKDVKSSMGQGVFLIEKPSDFTAYCSNVEVLYVQERLEIDRDIRINFVGNDIISGYWRVASDADFRNNVAQGGTIVYDLIPEAAMTLVKEATSILGINHAGFDIAMVDGHPYILEFNTLFGTKGLIDQKIDLGEIVINYLHEITPPHLPLSPLDNNRISS